MFVCNYISNRRTNSSSARIAAAVRRRTTRHPRGVMEVGGGWEAGGATAVINIVVCRRGINGPDETPASSCSLRGFSLHGSPSLFFVLEANLHFNIHTIFRRLIIISLSLPPSLPLYVAPSSVYRPGPAVHLGTFQPGGEQAQESLRQRHRLRPLPSHPGSHRW